MQPVARAAAAPARAVTALAAVKIKKNKTKVETKKQVSAFILFNYYLKMRGKGAKIIMI